MVSPFLLVDGLTVLFLLVDGLTMLFLLVDGLTALFSLTKIWQRFEKIIHPASPNRHLAKPDGPFLKYLPDIGKYVVDK